LNFLDAATFILPSSNYVPMLSHDELISLINKQPPLVDQMIDPDIQIQPNGIELTLQRVEIHEGSGSIAFDNSERKLPQTRAVAFDDEGWIHLPKGSYKIVFNEIVNIPKNIAAIAKPRSSLLRCGATVETAVWDAGYSGRSESLLVVYNENGFKIKKDARVLQLLFFRLNEEVRKGYSGVYQNENV
jgi:dUTP pyrophosphatase